MTAGASMPFDELAEVLYRPALREVTELTKHLFCEDLTACELVAVATVLRGAWERKQASEADNPPVVLTVVGNRTESAHV